MTLYMKHIDPGLNATPITLFGHSLFSSNKFYALHYKSPSYFPGLLDKEEIVDENNNHLNRQQICDEINNVNLTEVIQKLTQHNNVFILRNVVLKHPKITETHKRLFKMHYCSLLNGKSLH